EVHRARTERRHADAWSPRNLTRGIGHQSRDSFVACEDEIDTRLAGGFEEVEHLAARQSEHARDAGVTKGRGKDVGACRHCADSTAISCQLSAVTFSISDANAILQDRRSVRRDGYCELRRPRGGLLPP